MTQSLLSKNEYQQILQHPSIYLSDPRLKNCRVELDNLGMPRVRSGGWALTYRLHNCNKKWAVRCFYKAALDREKRYQAISKFIASHPSEILIKIEYQPAGIKHQGNLYPITIMDWVDGDTLETYVYKNIKKQDFLITLCYQFQLMVKELNRLQIAHGDLSGKNILIKDGSLILVDYDGMFVPELSGCKSVELGNPSFQHPGRNESHFGPYLDRFSEIVIFLALKSLSLSPDLYHKFGLGGEGLLFSQTDFIEPYSSKLIREIEQLPGLSTYAQNFRSICLSNTSKVPPLNEFLEGYKIEIQKSEEYIARQYGYQPDFWPIDARELGSLLERENENAVVIGKIDHVKIGETRYGDFYAFLNVGYWPDQTFTVVIWSEVLMVLLDDDFDPREIKGKWISVSGVISLYGKKPQIVLESPANIAIITKDEALSRLSKKTDALENNNKNQKHPNNHTPVRKDAESEANKHVDSLDSIANTITSINNRKVRPSHTVSQNPFPSSPQFKSNADIAKGLSKIYGPNGITNQHLQDTKPTSIGINSKNPSCYAKHPILMPQSKAHKTLPITRKIWILIKKICKLLK